jgi:predicted secreted protein
VREVSVGQIGGGAPMQKQMMAMARGGVVSEADAPMQMEPGARELSLTISGSVQMTK